MHLDSSAGCWVAGSAGTATVHPPLCTVTQCPHGHSKVSRRQKIIKQQEEVGGLGGEVWLFGTARTAPYRGPPLYSSPSFPTYTELCGLGTENEEFKWKQSFITTPLLALHICSQRHTSMHELLTKTFLQPCLVSIRSF